jgi:hypothetical protein
MKLERKHVAAAQGALFVLSGLWPIVSPKSFAAVTGPTREGWMVKTVGLLIAGVGAGLVLAAARDHVDDETALVGGLTAAALAGTDMRYGTSARRRSAFYVADAVLEALFVAGWLATARHGARGVREIPDIEIDIESWRPSLGS